MGMAVAVAGAVAVAAAIGVGVAAAVAVAVAVAAAVAAAVAVAGVSQKSTQRLFAVWLCPCVTVFCCLEAMMLLSVCGTLIEECVCARYMDTRSVSLSLSPFLSLSGLMSDSLSLSLCLSLPLSLCLSSFSNPYMCVCVCVYAGAKPSFSTPRTSPFLHCHSRMVQSALAEARTSPEPIRITAEIFPCRRERGRERNRGRKTERERQRETQRERQRVTH